MGDGICTGPPGSRRFAGGVAAMPEQSLLPGGVGTGFPPPCRPGEPPLEPTGTKRCRLQPYCERFVYNENSPPGLGEAASSKKHIRFQY